MKNYALPLFCIPLFLVSCGGGVQSYPEACFQWKFDSAHAKVAQYVDPFIGTGGHGHTFPGATAPFGMVQLSPDTRIDGSWDGCSGYHQDDHRIYGFSHTHLSGTGCSDYGDIMFMPGSGAPQIVPGNDSTPGYSSTFTHELEQASAGYYSVKLDNNVQCELTASPRVGVHRYTFNDQIDPWIILDMSHRDEVLECDFEVVDDHTIRGKRFSTAWATNQQLWFYAEFSEPFTWKLYSEGKEFTADSSMPKDLKVVLSFTAQQVEVKCALSPVSCDNAKMNLDTETGAMKFDDVRAKTEQHWDAELSRIVIETGDETKKRIFYTALYHCFIAPNVYCDVNGEYQGMDHKVYRDTVHQRYTVFSLWDTYRALHPLFTIVQQKRTNDFINTFLQQYKESGRLPVWELSSNETDCMIGYHSVSVITDAWMKGITGFDTAFAYEAMKASAMEDHFGLEYYKKYGFIPAEKESESVSRALEYAYDDWCISLCAQRMNDSAGIEYYAQRGNNWKNIYNPETGFMQARMNNSFFSPFNPFEVNNNYTEANAWQYSLAVQQSPLAQALLMGTDKYEQHLDSLFTVSSQTAGREQADITGLIGQYAHGNEPSHHMAYLYSTIHQDYKTQELVHTICNTLYTDKPDGLCGNEDCGQMSAWYVLSAAGFYQVSPGKPEYTFGSPQFSSVNIYLENGKTFSLNTTGADNDYAYCHVIEPEEEANSTYPNYRLPYNSIMGGMSIQIDKHDTIYRKISSETSGIQVPGVSAPWITGVTSRTFVDHVTIGMKTLFASNKIFYSIDSGDFKLYTSPITISKNSTIRMYSEGVRYNPGAEIIYERDLSDPKNIAGKIWSDTVSAEFFKAPSWKSIAIRNAYAPQYSAGGDRALIDGLFTNSPNFRTGMWQGYEGVDLDVIVDLGKEVDINVVHIDFMADENAWIFYPETVTAYITNDSSEFIPGSINTYTFQDDGTTRPRVQVVRLPGGKGRYVHVVGKSRKTCPPGHPGEGKPAWLFADEISIIKK